MPTTKKYAMSLGASLLVLAAATGLYAADRTSIPPRKDYAPVAVALERFIAHELQDKQLPALSIALVDGNEIVWARGFGYADPPNKVPATAATVYRVGSVSKLFTDIGVMQMAERGQIDIDAPVSKYLPDFRPANQFTKPVTLRQLMSHRSGLLREPPVGHYFDDTGPSIATTVRSLNGQPLIYEPGDSREVFQRRSDCCRLRIGVLEPTTLRRLPEAGSARAHGPAIQRVSTRSGDQEEARESLSMDLRRPRF